MMMIMGLLQDIWKDIWREAEAYSYSDLLGYHPIRIVVHKTPKDPKQVLCHYQRPVLSGLIERRGNTAQQHIPFLMNNRRATIPDHFCH